MKKPLFTIFLLLLGHICLAQETKTTTRDTSYYSEKFEVLKSNKAIRQGHYTLKHTYTNKIFTTGFYKNNVKDSVWREYDSQNNLLAEGNYKQGKRVGEWSAYDTKQRLLSKYDFDQDQLMFYPTSIAVKTKKYQVINSPGDTLFTTMDTPPFYITGQGVINRDIGYNARYPASAPRENTNATVIIGITIDEHGHARNCMITKSAGRDFDIEAYKVVKGLPDDWVPGKLNGKKVTAIIQMPVSFHFLAR